MKIIFGKKYVSRNDSDIMKFTVRVCAREWSDVFYQVYENGVLDLKIRSKSKDNFKSTFKIFK